MKCYNCRKEIENNLKYCPACGAEQGFSKELIEAAKAGDQEAITELYNRTYNNVYQSIYMLIKDQDTVLDILQDTYIKGFRSLEQLKNPDSFRAWIKTIGVNTAKNYLAKKKPLLFTDIEGGEEDELPELQIADDDKNIMPEESMDQKETHRLIHQVLSELSDEHRVLLSLYFFEEMNAREIGEFLGINENTVRSRLKAAKAVMEKKILALEKEQGVKIHSMLPIPFLAFLGDGPNAAVLQAVQSALSEGAKAGASLAAQSVVSEGASAVSKTAASAAAKTAGAGVAKAVSMKVVAAVTALAVTVGGGAVAVHKYNSSGEKDKAAVTTEQSLEGFAESQKTAAGSQYTGYLAMKDYEYEVNGQVYTGNGPGFDCSELPSGWLDWQTGDLDGDGEDELVAVTAEEGTVGLEVYEWDEEKEEAVQAGSFVPKREGENYLKNGGFNLADAGSVLSTFIYGEEEKYIGILLWESAPPIADGYTIFSFAAASYDGETLSQAGDAICYDEAIRDENMLEALNLNQEKAANLFEEIELPVTLSDLQAEDAPMSLPDLIAQKAAGYQQIVKITSDWGEYRDEINEWTQKAYGGENPEALALSTIVIDGEHPVKK